MDNAPTFEPQLVRELRDRIEAADTDLQVLLARWDVAKHHLALWQTTTKH